VSDGNIAFLGFTVSTTSWQLGFRSNDTQGRPILGITTLLVPTASYNGGAASRPLVTYQIAEDSLGTQCAPSYALRPVPNRITPAEQSEMSVALLRGWALNVPDYEGPNSAEMGGVQGAHIVLDSVRAARNFSQAGFSSRTPLGLWGYSAAGHATAWAAELQPTYAPELRIAGASIGGSPYSLTNSIKHMDGGPAMAFVLTALVGLSRAYPDWDFASQLNAAGKAMVAAIDGHCTIDYGFNYLFRRLDEFTIKPGAVDLPANKAIFDTDSLGHFTPTMPILIYYTPFDEAVPLQDTLAMIQRYCTGGAKVVSSMNFFSEHSTNVIFSVNTALDYLEARFTGKQLPSNCG
jgi:hypothetical protein